MLLDQVFTLSIKERGKRFQSDCAQPLADRRGVGRKLRNQRQLCALMEHLPHSQVNFRPVVVQARGTAASSLKGQNPD